MARPGIAAALGLSFALMSSARAQTPPPGTPPPPTTQNPPVQVPVPKPFPGTGGQTPPPVKPTTPATLPVDTTPAAPTPAGWPTVQELGGTPVYPGAEFVDSFDAGQGQRYYLYGTNSVYGDIVLYYKNVLKAANRELFRAPAMHQFDLGRYDEGAMAYPPSVVVKDYAWNDSPGYLVVKGTTEKRFKTIIQIVPK